MKNKDLWRNIIQVVVSILTAALTARGGHRHRQDQGTLTKERIGKEGVESDSLLLFCEFVNF